MDERLELARVTALERPWQLLAGRLALAEAVVAGVRLSRGDELSLASASAVVEGHAVAGRDPALGAARGWCDTLRFLAAAAHERAAGVDEGLVRSVHWLLHRHRPDLLPGRLRAGADLRLPPPPPAADPIDAAIWTAAAVRRADPCPTGTVVVAHAVEVLLLSQAGHLAPWYAGRPSPVGDPREVLQATAAEHLERCRAAEQRWFTVAQVLAAAGLADRMAGPCWDAASGLPLTNTSYRTAAAVVRRRPVSEQQASRDLRALVEAGLLQSEGRTRDRSYRWAAD